MKSLRIVLPAFLLAATLNAPAQSQTSTDLTLRQLISGKAVPLALRVKDLNNSFARFRFTGPSGDEAQRMMIRNMYGMNVAPNSIYFTKGDTIKMESVSYLIVYGPENRIDMEAVMRHDVAALQKPRKLRPRDKLLLSLLDLRNVGNISDLRPFDPEEDLENAADRNQAVVNTLRQLGQGILQWKHNRGQERLPRWTHLVTQELRGQMYPFVHDKRLWDHPSTGETFRLNPALAGVRLPDLTNRAQVYMVYEVTPAGDGTRGVLFANGRAERLGEARWNATRQIKPAILTAAQLAERAKAQRLAQERQMEQWRVRRAAELRRLEAELRANETNRRTTRRRR